MAGELERRKLVIAKLIGAKLIGAKLRGERACASLFIDAEKTPRILRCV